MGWPASSRAISWLNLSSTSRPSSIKSRNKTNRRTHEQGDASPKSGKLSWRNRLKARCTGHLASRTRAKRVLFTFGNEMKKERVLYFFVSFFGLWWLASLWRQFWTGSIVNFVEDNEKIKFMVLIDYDGFLITMVQKNTIDPQSRKIANIRWRHFATSDWYQPVWPLKKSQCAKKRRIWGKLYVMNPISMDCAKHLQSLPVVWLLLPFGLEDPAPGVPAD